MHHVCALERLDARIGALAGAQDGTVGRQQLIWLGATRNQISTRRGSGMLVDLHPGVYGLGHEPKTLRGRAIAALIAGGPGAGVSNLFAAAVWTLHGDETVPAEITLQRRRRDTQALRAYHCANPNFVGRHGLPITTVARTLLDCAASHPRHLHRLIREARVKGLVTEQQLQQSAHTPGHHGARALREALADPDSARTRSAAERRLLHLILDAALPRPETNLKVLGKERDLVWPQHRVAVEIDDYNTHGDAGSFHNDRARDAELAARGWLVLRFTRRQILDAPLVVLAQLAAALATSSWTTSSLAMTGGGSTKG